MRQKATWIIPGILVTLLLGLLWAMPASAADAGSVDFLDASGKKSISYVSLHGPAGTDGPDDDEDIDGFRIQVEDQDLNEPSQYNPKGKGRLPGGDAGDIDWTDLADMDGDGKINANDIGVYGTADSETEQDKPSGFSLDVVNGALIAGDAAFLEFFLNEQTTIGAFVNTRTEADRRATQARDADDEDIVEMFEFSGPTTTEDTNLMRDGNNNPTWADILVDSDSDRNYREHIEATTSVTYDNTDDSTENPVAMADATLKVSVVMDDEGDVTHVRVSSDGVTVDPDDQIGDTAIAVTIDASSDITLKYETVYIGMGSPSQIGLVTVDSSGGTEISIALRETSASSGKFRAIAELCNSDDCTASQALTLSGTGDDRVPGRVMVPVDDAGDTIEVDYSDADPRTTKSANISLDTDFPAFSGTSPASGTAGKDAEPDVSYEVVDGESGIASEDDEDDDSLRIVAALYEPGTDNMIAGPLVLDRDDLNVDEITDGFLVETRIREGGGDEELDAGTNEEYEIRWWAVAMDVAGNTGVSDSDSDTKCTYDGSALDVQVNDDGEITNGSDIVEALMDLDDSDKDNVKSCDPNVIRVDTAAPELVSAKTGDYLDGKEVKFGSLTSVVAVFDEALDCDTVTADDFLVDDVAPNDATCKGNKVYLDVAEMGSNDTPDVSVAEEAVSDRAGNPTAEDKEVESTDGIPAGLNVTVVGTGEGDRPITDADGVVTITISSDEKLKGRPEVQIRRVEEDYTLSGDDEGGESDPTGTANEWEFETDIGAAGLYNVYVTAVDRVSSGDSSAGMQPGVPTDHDNDEDTPKVPSEEDFELDADLLKGNKLILFEVDDGIQKPAFTPDEDESTDDENVFIRIDFASEGKEYGLEAKCTEDDGDGETGLNDEGKCAADYTKSNTGEFTDKPGDVATDFDTSGLVEITSATFNGDDVTDDIISRDWVLFVYRPGGLTDGDHKLEIEVMDKAGNEDEFSVEFSKTPRKPYKLALNPGPNLISFPANPVDGDVNAVFGGAGNEDIMSVVTFDNASGLWMTATRGEDGMFMGDLTNIDASHGYWVVADGVLDLSVQLSPGNVIGTPPFISVQQGWNLVPVTDTDQSEAGTGFATNEYFANVDAEVVYGYDSLSGGLVRLSTAKLTPEEIAAGEEQDMVVTGSAYWVYANEAGIIIP